MKNCPHFLSKINLLLLFMSMLLAMPGAHAQREYFVDVNPETGSYRKIKMLPDVNWINGVYNAYDQKSHRFLFCGSADAKDWRLYTVDALTGNVLYAPRFLHFGSAEGYVYNMQFNESDGVLYGLYWNSTARKLSFVNVDPVTGNYNIIKAIDEVQNFLMPEGYLSPMIDSKRNRYIFAGSDSLNEPHLYTLDIGTGNVLYNPPFVLKVVQMKYDAELGKIFGLYSAFWNHIIPGVVDTQQLVSVDPQTGLFEAITGTTIGKISGHNAIAGSYAYNEISHEYMFAGRDTSSTSYLVSLKVNGEIKNMVKFPYTNSAGANIIEFQYDRSLGRLFAIHWDPDTVSVPLDNSLLVYPNPFTGETHISLSEFHSSITAMIYDTTGKSVDNYIESYSNKVTVLRNRLPAGVYFARIQADGALIGTVKIIAR